MGLSKGAAVGSNPYVPVSWLTPDDSSVLSERNQTELLCQSNQHVVTGFRWEFTSELLCCCKPSTHVGTGQLALISHKESLLNF